MKDKAKKGKYLEACGQLVGINRKRFWFFFQETDEKYRKRIINAIERLRKGDIPDHTERQEHEGN